MTLAATGGAILVSGVNPLASGAGSIVSDPPSQSEPPSLVASRKPPVQNVSRDLTSSLAVFRRGAEDTDALPPRLQSMVEASIPEAGANGALARRAVVKASGTSVYLVPSQDGLCLVTSNGSQLFCSQQAAVLTGRATSSTDCSPTLPRDVVEIAGILPDGASDASVILSNGTRKQLSVARNAYIAQFSRTDPLPEAIRWNSPAGSHSVRSAVPSDAATIDCVTPADVESGKVPRPSGLPKPPEAR